MREISDRMVLLLEIVTGIVAVCVVVLLVVAILVVKP